LLEPMQRLTRYPILLKTVLHYTPKTHPDHESLVQASIKLEELVSKTNEAARNESDSIRLKELQAKIDLQGLGEDINLCSETRSLGPRRCLFDGVLIKAKSGRKLQAFLFNDMFLLTQHHGLVPVAGYEYSVYREPIPVHALLVREIQNEPPDTLNFQILHIQTQQIIAVKAPSLNDKRRWMREIDAAFTHYQVCLLFVAGSLLFLLLHFPFAFAERAEKTEKRGLRFKASREVYRHHPSVRVGGEKSDGS